MAMRYFFTNDQQCYLFVLGHSSFPFNLAFVLQLALLLSSFVSRSADNQFILCVVTYICTFALINR